MSAGGGGVYRNSANYLLARKYYFPAIVFHVRFVEGVAASTSHRSSVSAFCPVVFPRKCAGENAGYCATTTLQI